MEEKKSLQDLKAYAYDLIAQLEAVKQELGKVNLQISNILQANARAQQPVKK